MDEQKPSYLYAMTVHCHGGCGSRIVGQYRKSDDPEFSKREIHDFEKDVEEKCLWIRHQNEVFTCSPLTYEKSSGLFVCRNKFDLSQFSIPEGALKRYKTKLIDPDYYGTVTVANL